MGPVNVRGWLLGGCAGVGGEDGQLSSAADGSMASVPKDQALSLARLWASQCWFHTRAEPLKNLHL